MGDSSHLLQDPTFMALIPFEMVEYLERLNLSDSPPCPARTNLLSGMRRMFENNAPLHEICFVMLEMLANFQLLQEQQQQQLGEGNNNGETGGEQQQAEKPQQEEGDNDKTGGEQEEEGGNDETGGQQQKEGDNNDNDETGGEKQDEGNNNETGVIEALEKFTIG